MPQLPQLPQLQSECPKSFHDNYEFSVGNQADKVLRSYSTANNADAGTFVNAAASDGTTGEAAAAAAQSAVDLGPGALTAAPAQATAAAAKAGKGGAKAKGAAAN